MQASAHFISSSLRLFVTLFISLHRIIDGVIRRFFRDRDVVWMAFGHARGADSGESRVLPQQLDVLRAAIAHAGTQAADELIDKISQRPTIRYAAFDAFGDELARRFDTRLPVAVLAALHHGPHATHAAI